MTKIPVDLWALLDWTRQDCVIAKGAGVSRERVRQMRRTLEMPRSVNHQRRLWMKPPLWTAAADWTRPTSVIIETAGVSKEAVGYWRRKLGKPRPKTWSRRYENVDWSQQDTVIARSLGVTPCAVGRMRKRLGKPQSPAYWKGVGRRCKSTSSASKTVKGAPSNASAAPTRPRAASGT